MVRIDMSKNNLSPSLNWQLRLSFTLILPIFLLSLAICLYSPWRNKLQNSLRGPDRQLLSTVIGDLRNDGKPIKILKFRTRDGLVLEFLGSGEAGARPLLDRVTLADPYDGYFDFGGEATRMAIVDLDGDKKFELIAPSFDQNLIAHLNTFKYNAQTEKFEPY